MELKNKKKVLNWSGLKKGTKFIVENNSNNHNYPIGEVLTLKMDGWSKSSMCDVAEEVCDGNNLNASDICVLDWAVESMKEEFKKLEKEKDELLQKIKFCEDNGLEVFDEDEYKIYAALDILESTKSKKEKAELLSKILKK